MKNNKEDISKKTQEKKETANQDVGFNYDDFYANQLAIDPEIVEEANAKGVVLRWINRKLYVEKGNFHKAHWRPYKSEVLGKVSSFSYGKDPDGYLVRGDVILACRPKELDDKHKKFLADKALRQTKAVSQTASEIKNLAKQAGVNTYVDDSYGEED